MSIERDIDQLKKQEAALRFSGMSEDDAWALGCLMRAKAEALGLPFVIHIQLAGRALFYCAMAGTTPDHRTWVTRKINGVMRYQKSSYLLGREIALSGKALDEDRGVARGEIAPHGGSFPIRFADDQVLGTITVSGVPQRDDHNFVVACIAEFLKLDGDALALGPES